MPSIRITDLEVFYRVGITDEERAKPQRLLISVDMEFDLTSAAATDRIEETIDYQQVAQKLLRHGDGRSWNLLEKLATDLADLILAEFQPQAVTIEVKKFPIPQARFVSVALTRKRTQR